MANRVSKNVSLFKGAAIFAVFTAYFCLLLGLLLPAIQNTLVFRNPIMYWIIVGYCLFVPLLVCALLLAKGEGHRSISGILSSLCIKRFSQKDWKYAVLGLAGVIVCSGVIYGGSILLHKIFGMRLLSTQVWFMDVQPLQGQDKIIILLLWLPMFFFNIFGEELLWRGYIQSRLRNKNRWVIYSMMWLIFHIPFGVDFLILLMPIVIIIPYIFSKRRNTLIGCFIHGLYNGPAFILVLTGII